MATCYAVSSGEYSDYKVHCVFENEADALSYVRAYNERDMRATHDKNVAAGYVPPNAQYTCRDPIETCPGCGQYFAHLENWVLRVEPLDFYAADVAQTLNIELVS